MIKVYAMDCRPYRDEARLADTLPHLDSTRRTRVLRLQNPQKNF